MVRIVALLAWCMLSGTAWAADAMLTVDTGQGAVSYSRAALLRRADTVDLVLPTDPVYHGTLGTVRAIRLGHLLGVAQPPAGSTIEVKSLDGFTATLDAARLIGGRSTAYLAVEPTNRRWPPLKKGQMASAGPFYLVWQHPAASGIGNEEWPYQIASISILAPIGERYPAILPDPSIPADGPIAKGFTLFQRTCFACHTLNGQGPSTLGPDLNLPLNPTEYLQPGMLERLVRNPQDLRHWPQSKMPGFDRGQLSDDDLAAIVGYLRHMAGRKGR